MKDKIVDKTQSLLECLKEMSPDSSTTTLRSWLKHGLVSVDGEEEKVAKTELKIGQTVAVGAKTKKIGGLRIVYEDPALIVVDKPAGLLSVATDTESDRTAHAILKKHYGSHAVFIVHRLDQATSGLLIFARTKKTQEALKDQLAEHKIEREYDAVVEGNWPQTQGTWRSYLWEDAHYYVHSGSNPNKGKLAITHWKKASSGAEHMLFRVRLETGRKNQIRVHCQAAGIPIAGDKKYGAKGDALGRLGLHARQLTLTHPVTKRVVCVKSPTPREFFTVVEKQRS